MGVTVNKSRTLHSHGAVPSCGATGSEACCPMLALLSSPYAQRGFVGDDKFAAWSIVATTNGTVRTAIGAVTKHHSNPLLVQDQPWELRLDNSYPNIVHNPADPLGAYRMWYGGFIAGKKFETSQGSGRVNAWHYANSSDGIHWQKPPLNIFDLATESKCSAAARRAGKPRPGAARALTFICFHYSGLTPMRTVRRVRRPPRLSPRRAFPSACPARSPR